ncbi:hypothetical protein [uncultured Roseobacter sp.]|uniref:hypothetical protein n=1 Tax=uncultured Roseobacter sp. TaxID=114847 RepID=UPI00262C1DCE|nr:hypothetical protein [uncultured Roseobacter sp.]
MQAAIETHTRLAKAQYRKLIKLFKPQVATTPALAVGVLSGSQAGTSTEIDVSNFTVGPDPTNDIMILDDEALGGEARFSIETSFFGPLLTIETARRDLRIDGAAIEPDLPSAPERLPCKVDFNGVLLRFQSTDYLVPVRPHRRYQAIVRLSFLVAFSAFAAHLYIANSPEPPFVLHSEPSFNALEPRTAVVASEHVVNELIVEAGLSPQLQVEQAGAGTLSISGLLPSDKMKDWYRIRGEIDGAASGTVIISDVSEMPTLSQLPAIAVIRLSPTPTIILANGTKLGLGDPIDGDWIIRSIGVETLEVERGDETVTVSF